MRRLQNWLKSYIEYSSHSEAPTHLHFWTGVSVMAACLRRKVWIDQYYFQWYPNFYIIMVAPPGIVNKSTAISIGFKLLKDLKEVNIGADIATWQSIIAAFENSQQAFRYDDHLYTMAPITYACSELGNFLDPKNKDQVNLLIKLWDGEDITKTTKHVGDMYVKNSWINLIACTTPSWINDNINENMIQGGLTSRCLFAYADKKRQAIAYPGLIERDKTDQLREDLIHDLKEISSLIGTYTLTKEAIEWGKAWYENHINNLDVIALEKYGGYANRKQSHIHKLAMVLSAAERNDMIITLDDLQLALRMIEDLEPDMMRVFSGVGKKSISHYTDKLLLYIQQRGSVPYQQAYQYVHMHFPEFSGYENVLVGLNKAGYIKMERIHGVQYLTSTGKKLQ